MSKHILVRKNGTSAHIAKQDAFQVVVRKWATVLREEVAVRGVATDPGYLGALPADLCQWLGKINEVGSSERYWEVLGGMKKWQGEGFFTVSDTL